MSENRPDSRSKWLLPGLSLAFALLCMWPLIVNRGVFLFADTTTYIRAADAASYRITGNTTDWTNEFLAKYPSLASQTRTSAPKKAASNEDKIILAGRSIYYGAIAFAADQTAGLWLLTLAQAALCSFAAVLTARRLGSETAPSSQYTRIMIVPLVTSVGFFANFVMPDFLAPISILATAIIGVFWHKMLRSEQLFWIALLTFGLLSHSANILIVCAVSAAAAARLRTKVALLPIIFCIVTALTGEFIFSTAVNVATGHPPVRPPFLTARLIDDGPGLEYLRSRCRQPKAPFAACQYIDRMPSPSDTFLWSQDPAQGVFMTLAPPLQRVIAQEELAFALAVTTDSPLAVLKSSLQSVFQQLTKTGLSEFVTPEIDTARLPSRLDKTYQRTAAVQGRLSLTIFERVVFGAVLVSLFGIATILLHNYRNTEWFSDRFAFVFLIGSGIIANIIICGALSTPHDRYLSRTLWLIPLTMVSLSIGHTNIRKSRSGLVA